MENNKFIAIEGVIGVGKTTLARLLQPTFNASVLLEVFEENPFLASFYDDRARYAFQTQIFFLLSRYHQQNQAVPESLIKGNLISDYTFAKDELFAWLNLKDDELAMYGRVHAALAEKLPKPNLIVYLHADHEVVMRRIALRDRPYERDMDPTYIKDLANAYEAWLQGLSEQAVLTIDVTDLDFLSNSEHLDQVVSIIQDALAQQTDGLPVDETPATLLKNGRLPEYQQFHHQLDRAKNFDPDLFFNYILLSEEMGELASELIRVWGKTKRAMGEGQTQQEAYDLVLSQHRASIRDELADLLAYLLKISNYVGVDLEQAYIEKMEKNIGRSWSKHRTLPNE
ncbi:MAG: deoxynucleoside kinase [Chloroflexota bacterium]